MDASNWTTPCSFGNPPYPTEVSLGSSSVTFADFSIASNISSSLFQLELIIPNVFFLEKILDQFLL